MLILCYLQGSVFLFCFLIIIIFQVTTDTIALCMSMDAVFVVEFMVIFFYPKIDPRSFCIVTR